MDASIKHLRDNNSDYYIGLDIGTNSVGWAMTDNEYDLLNLNGKPTWGIRLFDESRTAKDRRLSRSMRRRLHRRRVRLNYLKELFRPKIEKIDPNFFARLQNSYLYIDKSNDSANISGSRKQFADKHSIQLVGKNKRLKIFEGNGISDKEYYSAFPTIYHLRKALIDGNVEKYDFDLYDPRLVYLALYSLLKHRGHFLSNVKSVQEYSSSQVLGENLNALAQNLGLKIFYKDNKNIDDIKMLYTNKYEKKVDGKIISKTDKKNEFSKIVVPNSTEDCDTTFTEKEKTDLFYKIIKLTFGSEVSFNGKNENSVLYNRDCKINYSKENCEDQINAIKDISNNLGQAIECGYAVYAWSKFYDIMKECEFLSEAKIKSYEDYKKDLIWLKGTVKALIKDKEPKVQKNIYEKIFGDKPYYTKDMCNYIAYSMGKDKTSIKTLKKYIDEELKGEFTKYFEEKKNAEYKSRIEDESFLVLQRHGEDAVVPNCVIKDEYKKILENAKSKLKFLEKEDKSKYKNDGSGKTLYEKISSLIDFKIPYYCGPLSYERDIKENSNIWIVRKKNYENKEIMPWIFDDVIDKAKTREPL